MEPCNKTNEKEQFYNIDDGIKYYYNYYPDKHYLSYPEFAVKKLGLNTNILNKLNKDISKRSREDIRDWMINSKITYEELIYVGW